MKAVDVPKGSKFHADLFHPTPLLTIEKPRRR
jgi:hypothetical protein